MLIAATSFAQISLLATLTHGDSISIYYGTYALKNALAVASDGDVINLSGGAFQAAAITKAVAIRGTGINDADPTIISGNFEISIPETTERLTVEGCKIPNVITVKGKLVNAYFIKNSIGRIDVNSVSHMVNGTFANCDVYGMDLYGNSKVQFVNSRIDNFDNKMEQIASASFINCILIPNAGYHANYIRTSQLMNCILVNNNSAYGYLSLPTTTTAMNCVSIGKGNSIAFKDVVSKVNCSYANIDIFQDSDIWKELTDEAKETYVGNDGTPVGIYGGILPYNTTPSYPQITKMNVANKTTADGKLSVEIEVRAVQ